MSDFPSADTAPMPEPSKVSAQLKSQGWDSPLKQIVVGDENPFHGK
ncbi:hypothetical protein [Arthrobacter sp. GMC3]|nr:hypothetical protein [Arthrobacter sp. GMC3]